MQKQLLIAIASVAALLFAALWLREPAGTGEARASLFGGEAPDVTGFARATEPDGMTFPDAFGPHPEYQTEWWYYTGNVETAEGRPFGYQFTIFRRSLRPEVAARESSFAAQSLYMAHFALTDGAAGQFYAKERFQRGASGVAGARAAPYAVWLDDWGVTEEADGSYRMMAAEGEIALDLTLRALKPPARHGDNGLSAKSGEPGNASYYYSQTRLATEGAITVRGERFAVSGLSWKDHEYGTSALGADAVGWDWFSLQLSDGRELMYFNIRTDSGAIEPASSGSLIREDGSVRPLSREEVRIEVLDRWRSPDSGGEYPSRWRLSVPSEGVELTLTPLIPNQELNLSVTYWEGSILIEGSANGAPVTGRGYIELTGYGGDRAPSVFITPPNAINAQADPTARTARVAERLPTQEIAAGLTLRVTPVNYPMQNLYSKLAVTNRTEAARLYLERGRGS